VAEKKRAARSKKLKPRGWHKKTDAETRSECALLFSKN
jgi:hypothetical protein